MNTAVQIRKWDRSDIYCKTCKGVIREKVEHVSDLERRECFCKKGEKK